MASPSKPLSVSNVFKGVAPVPAVRRCYLTLGLAESQRHGIGPSLQSSDPLRAHALSFADGFTSAPTPSVITAEMHWTNWSMAQGCSFSASFFIIVTISNPLRSVVVCKVADSARAAAPVLCDSGDGHVGVVVSLDCYARALPTSVRRHSRTAAPITAVTAATHFPRCA